MIQYETILLNNITDGETSLEKLNKIILNHISYYKFSNIEYFNKEFTIIGYPENVIDELNRKKYGICMDLNYAFSIFLSKYGYENYFVKCLKPGSRSDIKGIYHLSLIVFLDRKKYFVDVGYGDLFTKAIPLENSICDGITIKSVYPKYIFYIGKQKLMIEDIKLSINNLKKNYYKFLISEPGDMAINRSVFERIYDRESNKYIQPLGKCNL